MSKHNIQLGSTILGRFGVIGLFGLAVLGLAACGGGDSSGGASSPPMTITPPVDRPDLVISSTSVSDDTLTPGQQFTLSVTVRNQGDGQAPPTTLRYKSHEQLPIQTSDPTVGTDSVTSLGPSGTASESVSLTAPSTPGTYHYGACVDSVSGESDTSNNCSGRDGVRVTVRGESTQPSGQPDLVIQSNSVSDNTLTPGQSFTLSVTVRNRGNGRASATTLRYKSHEQLPIQTSDPTVGTDSVTSLGPSGTASESISLTAPSTPGTYHYGACVDSVSGESDTSNNCSGNQGVRVTVRAAPTGSRGITFTITDGCNDGLPIKYRFFANDASSNTIGTWPGGNRVYITQRYAQPYTHHLACSSETDKICFGARRELPGGRTSYWGVDISDDKGCPNCCTQCPRSGQGSRTPERLTCPQR